MVGTDSESHWYALLVAAFELWIVLYVLEVTFRETVTK
jgi:hypothetical protein